MLTVGIVGGIGPESTLDYYKNIVAGYRNRTNDENYPHIIINSINMTEMLSYVYSHNYNGLTDFLLSAIASLKSAGADFAVIASNTPHVVFDQVNNRSSLPLISIVEATCKKTFSLRLKKVLLIGTGFTMRSTFYQECFSKYGIAAIVPSREEQEIIQNIIFPDLENGIIAPEKKQQLLDLCNDRLAKESAGGIVLGCTELPLMIKDDDFAIAVLNTTQIHIDAIVEILVNGSSRLT